MVAGFLGEAQRSLDLAQYDLNLKPETAALVGAPEGTRLEVVMEPTGPAWLPIAVFFSVRGHAVFRVSSQRAADLRRFRNMERCALRIASSRVSR